MPVDKLRKLAGEIEACTICAEFLPLGPRPVFQVGSQAKILVAGQAPGTRVHETGIPFNDPSGDRLRDWMGVTREQFYDASKIAILPMGFCYPGMGKSGDLPPRPECAPQWRDRTLSLMPGIELTLVIGKHALDWHLPNASKKTLTAIVKSWRDYQPGIFVMPHPSPRNNIWLKKNAWFESEVLPKLRAQISAILDSNP